MSAGTLSAVFVDYFLCLLSFLNTGFWVIALRAAWLMKEEQKIVVKVLLIKTDFQLKQRN